MITISLCMIVKNESDILRRCLSCTREIADEIIIVDTGSTDNTKEIAKEFTNLIFDFEWIDDFSAARNFAFSKASMDYCMWLDADDIIPEQEQEKFLNLKHQLTPSTNMVMMKYVTGFDEKGNPSFSYYRERLIKNHAGYYWGGKVHEVITPSGNIIYSEIQILHKKMRPTDSDRNLNIYEKMIANGEALEPRAQYYYARELFYHDRFVESANMFEGFLREEDGWVENKIEACRQLALCYYQINSTSQALQSLLKSFELDVPRAEICCDIGRHFYTKNQYLQAIFWYRTALSTERNDKTGAFILDDCYGYIPAIQLAVCYDKLGQNEQGNKYNEIAGIYKPTSEAFLQNRQYFVKALGKENI